MTDVVIVRPSSDAVEQTMSIWVDLLFPPGTSLPGVSVQQDLGQGVTAVGAQAGCQGCDVLLYFGHGTETSLGDPALIDVATVGCASGSTVIAIACLSGEALGPTAVASNGVTAYLGFTEPLFVYNARPSVIGTELADRLRAQLQGVLDVNQLRADLESDLQGIESLYRTGYYSTLADAPLVWMGARMNWRGLVAL